MAANEPLGQSCGAGRVANQGAEESEGRPKVQQGAPRITASLASQSQPAARAAAGSAPHLALLLACRVLVRAGGAGQAGGAAAHA